MAHFDAYDYQPGIFFSRYTLHKGFFNKKKKMKLLNPCALVQAYQFIWVTNDHRLHWHGWNERPCREKSREIHIVPNITEHILSYKKKTKKKTNENTSGKKYFSSLAFHWLKGRRSKKKMAK